MQLDSKEYTQPMSLHDVAMNLLIVCCLNKLSNAGAKTVRSQIAGHLAPRHRVDGMTLNDIHQLIQKNELQPQPKI